MRKRKTRRPPGSGRVFQATYRDRNTGDLRSVETWSIRWYDPRARQKRTENTGLRDKAAAEELLSKRIADMRAGIPLEVSRGTATFADLARLVEADYKANGRRSLDRVQRSLKRLGGWFDCRAIDITTERAGLYVAERLRQGEAAATVNRDLAALKRALTLGARAGMLARKPYIQLLAEHNARQGFFERADFDRVLSELPQALRGLAECYYLTGWRKRELLSRQWKHVDFDGGWLRLEPGETKSGRGRTFPLLPQLRVVLERLRAATRVVERERGIIVPWIFHRNGKAIREYRDAWRIACKRAGVADRFVHDCRRTAVRNLEMADVERSAAMAMVGIETDSIFRRYAIVDAKQLKAAGAKLSQFLVEQKGSK